ncbi:methylated-DNA--[protein]-cysteine S-methyltransferase [bacterium]|nr:methylated-DNA--[protein]-cysteine S-methyltransferase [bacterium]
MLNRDSNYEGIFIVAVKTTGIFCRVKCPARKPKRENVEFYPDVKQAMLNGYRPCKRCRPLEQVGNPPEEIFKLLEILGKMEVPRLSDAEVRKQGIDPAWVRRWFKQNHGITFQGWLRAMRVSLAYDLIKQGSSVTASAFDAGYESFSGFASAWGNHIKSTPRSSNKTNVIRITRISTPLGPMLAGATDAGICLLDFVDRRALNSQLSQVRKALRAELLYADHEHFSQLRKELADYFRGESTEFNVSLDVHGTDFQKSVWNVLREIPFGQTRSYREQAERIGKSGAVRAVANANGANRVSIIIPCHRVIGSDGSLTGYGGGLERKRYLLDHEQAVVSMKEPAP